MADILVKDIITREEEHGFNETVTWLLSQALSREGVSHKERTYEKSVKELKAKKANLRKSLKRPNFEEKYSEFLSSPFKFPMEKSSSLNESTSASESESSFNEGVVANMAVAVLQAGELLEEADAANQSLNTRCEALQSTSEQKSSAMKRLRSSEQYYKSKVVKLEAKLTEDQSPELHGIEAELEAAKQQLAELQEKHTALKSKCQQLNDTVNELQHANELLDECIRDQQVVSIYDPKTQGYKPNLHRCVHKLLESNVSTTKMSSVIEAVLDLVNVSVDHELPSDTCYRKMNIQRGIISQMQVLDQLSKEDDLTVATDEAMHYNRKYATFNAITSDDTTYVMGLRDLLTKSGKDTLDSFMQIMFDFDKLKGDEINPVSRAIVVKIRNIMTDRASSEKKFAEHLESYRAEILPLVKKNWEKLEERVRINLSKLHRFYCGLHVMIHVAEVNAESLCIAERHHFDDKPAPIYDPTFRKAKESGVLRLIRTACKAFSLGGDQKNGCYARFIVYIRPWLEERGLKSLPLTRFNHNRYSIVVPTE